MVGIQEWCAPDLSALSSLLGANERNDSAELCTLRCLFPDDLLIDTFGLGKVGSRLEHAVLKREHLLKGIVEEWSAEADVLWSTSAESHLEFARYLLRCVVNE